MNRRDTLKAMGIAALGATTGTGNVQGAESRKKEKTKKGDIYLGMCVGHYKSEGLNRARRVEKLARTGFKYINSCSFQKPAPDHEWRELKRVVQDCGIVPVQCGSGIALWGEFDPAEGDKRLDAVKPYLDKCADIGNKLICMLPPVWHEDLPFEVSWGTSIEWTRQYAALCKERGLAITCEIEPERDYITCRFGDAVRWIEQVNCDNFFMNVDTGHLCLWKFRPEWIRKYSEMVVHTHLSENNGRKHQSWTLGTGTTNHAGYFKSLIEGGFIENAKKHGIPPVACMEFYIPGHNKSTFDEELKTSMDWVKQHLPYMKLS